MPSEPLQAALHGASLEVVASGPWTAAHAGALEPLVEKVIAGASAGSLSLDIHGVREIDTFGACLMERLLRSYRASGKQARMVGVSDQFRGLLLEIDRIAAAPAAPAKKDTRFAILEAAGRATLAIGQDFVTFIAMLGALGDALIRILVRPRTFRLTSVVNQLDRVGLRAVPIIFLITFLIGGIIAQQGFFHFRKFAAEDYTVDLVGILVLRELGVLIVAIMVAGRSGSSYTAEIGSMKMREEIDALRTMGLDPVEVLLLPRVIALVIALPILTFLGSMAALYGGGVVAWLYGGMSPSIYISRLKEAVSITHFEVGIIKAPFMALVIGVVACAEGLLVKGSAESLGLRTTTSVVKSIFLVIVLDGFFAIFFASIGM
ncbi:ABC transporter permease [Methylocella tundrae]|uniref:ABC transporter permease n=1 Tax=Methylocella tundrae TaxID=227605 RepID=A0A4U8Z705_METTU|nr:MlaE family lipid ABC transporter permease subunit [Methylocella tundrae]WPP02918.1 MlaE family lipid ABC transporter permease subunit [Methylocella tundrae]VFU16565.1 ABC transporter permease [Methylocella tundrae]